jgi:hypothetical protein
MLILDNDNNTIILDSIYSPMLTDYMWVLDLNILDYTLAPLLVLEEIISPAIQLYIDSFSFVLPANWNMLIVDEETTRLDIVEVSEIPGNEFTALVYGPNKLTPAYKIVSAINYYPSFMSVSPSLNKYQMLCHPISGETWVNISPSDTFNKYLKNLVIGDLI